MIFLKSVSLSGILCFLRFYRHFCNSLIRISICVGLLFFTTPVILRLELHFYCIPFCITDFGADLQFFKGVKFSIGIRTKPKSAVKDKLLVLDGCLPALAESYYAYFLITANALLCGISASSFYFTASWLLSIIFFHFPYP